MDRKSSGCDTNSKCLPLAVMEERMIQHIDFADNVLDEIKQMSLKHGEKIDLLSIQVRNLDAKIDLDAKTTDIKIAQSNERLRDYIVSSFATKEQLADGIGSIKASARLMCSVMVVMGGLVAWLYENFIK